MTHLKCTSHTKRTDNNAGDIKFAAKLYGSRYRIMFLVVFGCLMKVCIGVIVYKLYACTKH